MGLFSSDEKKPDTERSADNVKSESVRSMSGFASLADVKRQAPTDDAEGERPVRGRKSASEKQRSRSAETAQAAKKDAAKEELKKKALEVVGEDICADIASIPYDVWAFWMADPNLALTKDEQEKLAKSYFLLAQVMEPDLSSPWMLGVMVLLNNVRMVGRRFTYLAIKKSTGEEIPIDEVEARLKAVLQTGRKPS